MRRLSVTAIALSVAILGADSAGSQSQVGITVLTRFAEFYSTWRPFVGAFVKAIDQRDKGAAWATRGLDRKLVELPSVLRQLRQFDPVYSLDDYWLGPAGCSMTESAERTLNSMSRQLPLVRDRYNELGQTQKDLKAMQARLFAALTQLESESLCGVGTLEICYHLARTAEDITPVDDDIDRTRDHLESILKKWESELQRRQKFRSECRDGPPDGPASASDPAPRLRDEMSKILRQHDSARRAAADRSTEDSTEGSSACDYVRQAWGRDLGSQFSQQVRKVDPDAYNRGMLQWRQRWAHCF